MAVAPARRAALVGAGNLFILCQRGSSSADESGKVGGYENENIRAAGAAKEKTSRGKSCAEIALDDFNALIELLRMSNAVAQKKLADAGKYFGGHRWPARDERLFQNETKLF